MSGSLVRAPVEPIAEPRSDADQGGDGEGRVLGAFERLGMIEDGVLAVVFGVMQGKDMEQQGMSSETRRMTRDGGRGASEDRAI
jgi:hypothetical protein